MLFKVHFAKDFKELNPEIEAIEEFERLTSRQLMAVALVADYESPLRTLPERERRTEAAKIAGYQYESDGKRLDKNARDFIDKKVKNIEVAIEKYRSIQYNEQQAMLEAIDAQIQEAIEMMKMDKEEACTVTKTKTTKSGEVSKEIFVDQVQRVKFITEAMKLGARLPELKETKEKLLASSRKDESVNLGTAYVAPEDISESTEHMSTLDAYMAEQRKNETE